jgi:hypothetical protein
MKFHPSCGFTVVCTLKFIAIECNYVTYYCTFFFTFCNEVREHGLGYLFYLLNKHLSLLHFLNSFRILLASLAGY